MKRRRARECALQFLFQQDFAGKDADLESFWKDRDEEREVKEFASSIVRGTLEHLEEIDAGIKRAAEHWVLERMAAVDRNILRAAAYELLFCRDIPPAVAINEALEIAKKYSSSESVAFINGILDRISRSLHPGGEGRPLGGKTRK
jgi:N utilization substance protein B